MKRILWLSGIFLGLTVGLAAGIWLVAEGLWFAEMNYLSLFWLRLQAQGLIWTIVTSLSLFYVLGNLTIAQRQPQANTSLTFQLNFPWLLLLSFSLSGLIEWLLLHWGQTIAALWQQSEGLAKVPQLPTLQSFWQPLWQLGTQLGGWLVVAGGLVLGTIALLVYPRFFLWTIGIGASLTFGTVLAVHWQRLLLSLQATPFDRTDPLFSKDIGFYVFSLPVWELLTFWLTGLSLLTLAAVGLTYLLSRRSLSEGKFAGLTQAQTRHLAALSGGWMITLSLNEWLSRFQLLYSDRGVIYGASYTDVHVELPVHTVLSLLASAIALFLFQQAVWRRRSRTTQRTNTPVFAVGAYLLLNLAATHLLPSVIQRLVVQPNELTRERPYIQRSIASTRSAFGLDAIDSQTFDPQGELTAKDLQKNLLTIRNIRLWDTRPLLATNRQLQQIRPYYRFFDADLDRYTLPSAEAAATPQNLLQQVLIAARELDYRAVPAEAQTWENEHLVYTHGYGFTISPVNKVATGGLPDYLVKDIGTDASNSGRLKATSDRIPSRIPTEHPRIYYGEGTDTYVMTGTRVSEFDYPSGNDSAYNIYDGKGGIEINSWRRWLFALYLRDWQMALTRNFTPQTKLLFRRNIAQRIRTIAPFLQYDSDPYLVVADTGNSQNYLYWIVDAYTTSDRYPYSDPEPRSGQEFNYIRNSVKVVIDAYNGSVDFYVADPNDPIVQTWRTIFPDLLKPLATIPPALRSHLRYPTDIFSVQAERLMAYHMTDPQVFYNREDQWQIPTEIYGDKPRLVEPYYLILKLPTAATEEFILLLPYTPNQRTNLTAWLASRSDGENYGKSLLYRFPKQQLVYGTEQIEARINQDPVISQQISLWNRQGSRAIQGNLLVIPIERSLLYVEPLYLEAEQNSLPTLVRVIVAYENRIVMAETLEQALQAIFQPEKPTAPVVRSVQ
jgi:hypothetical protein